MQTKLPFEANQINSLEDVKKYLAFLVKNEMAYHLEDDAKNILSGYTGKPLFSNEDADKANAIAGRLFELTKGTYLDPFSFFLNASKLYLFRDHSGRGIAGQLTDTHIRELWDLEQMDEDETQTLYDFLDEAEIGNDWHADASELIRIA